MTFSILAIGLTPGRRARSVWFTEGRSVRINRISRVCRVRTPARGRGSTRSLRRRPLCSTADRCRPDRCPVAPRAAAAWSCRRSRSGSRRTSETTGRWTRAGRSSRTPSTSSITRLDLANNCAPRMAPAKTNLGRPMNNRPRPISAAGARSVPRRRATTCAPRPSRRVGLPRVPLSEPRPEPRTHMSLDLSPTCSSDGAGSTQDAARGDHVRRSSTAPIQQGKSPLRQCLPRSRPRRDA